jgi:hypothetical protein
VPLKDRLRSRTARDRREERDMLGFVRQPAVRWLSPGLLMRSGVEVVVSGTFGRFADKREIQTEPQDGLDHSDADELWVDYLSDTGDGWAATYTMAWLLARESLDVDGERLPRGKLLLLGGDEVYPIADAVAYENRFIGPFAAALPASGAADQPELYALPGNHDWYDGLVSFLRVFCARDGIGGWATRQRRSYFALKLPHDWWIWGIDIQLDTYLDKVQLDYFRAQPVNRGDKILLLTAKPAWVRALPGKVEPASWRYLSYFEERIVRASGGRLVATITGDLHHYARYEPRDADDAPTRLTAGGGGAYLSGTHTLYPELHVRSLDHDAAQTVTYTREQIYPRAADSRRLSTGILKLALLNPPFARMLGLMYVVLGVAMLGALNSGPGALFAKATQHGLKGFLAGAAGGVSIILAGLLFGFIHAGTEIVPRPLEPRRAVIQATRAARVGVALLHTALHLAIASLVLWAVITLVGNHPLVIWTAGLAALFAAGTALGATLFGAFLLAIHRVRGVEAWETANRVFAGQSIPDYKNLLRMRFAADGTLTIHPLGVERVGRDWRYDGTNGAQPRFSPGDPPPAVQPIDVPLRYDASGRRVR